MTIYMAVTTDKYRLPVCMAYSARELARMLGVKENAISSSLSHTHNKDSGRVRYVKVQIDDEEDD